MEYMRKKRIFIGSSSETKELAKKLRECLLDVCDCSVWYDDFFELGNYVFQDLIQKAVSYDYAILIGGEDDKVVRLQTNAEKISPRDNIYLEYGMFSGILSTNRILFLIHKNCSVASDLAGMTLMSYDCDEAAIIHTQSWIRNMLSGKRTKVFSALDIELLPTVGIAVGYYHNFVKPLLEILRQTRTFSYQGESYPITTKKLIIHVPSYLEGNDINNYKYSLMEREQLVEASLKYRILINPEDLKSGRLIIHDIPSTLLSVFKTIDYIFDLKDHETQDSEYAKYRALDNFYDTIPRLMERDVYLSRYVELRRYSFPED